MSPRQRRWHRLVFMEGYEYRNACSFVREGGGVSLVRLQTCVFGSCCSMVVVTTLQLDKVDKRT